MAVYVDDSAAPRGRARCCRMVADSLDELRAMADALDVAPRWERRTPDGDAYFGISREKRAWAVRHGAIEVTTAGLDALLASRRRLAAAERAKLRGVGRYRKYEDGDVDA